jgi:hypothetical protein
MYRSEEERDSGGSDLMRQNEVVREVMRLVPVGNSVTIEILTNNN